jgi:hypothetical protein
MIANEDGSVMPPSPPRVQVCEPPCVVAAVERALTAIVSVRVSGMSVSSETKISVGASTHEAPTSATTARSVARRGGIA